MLSEENVRWEAKKAGVSGEGGRRQEGECGGSGSRRNDAGCNIENRPEDGQWQQRPGPGSVQNEVRYETWTRWALASGSCPSLRSGR